jgi:hypothetical protein
MHLNIDNVIQWKGHIKVITVHQNGRIQIDEFDNLVMNAAKNAYAGFLSAGIPVDLTIRYMGVGSSNTAVAATQTQLVSEQFRQQVTVQAAGSTGVMVTTTYISPFNCNAFTTQELAWFAGPLATVTANSGLMIARVLYSHAKTSLESITVTRTDTFS